MRRVPPYGANMKRVLQDWTLGARSYFCVSVALGVMCAQSVSAMPTTLWQHVTALAVECDIVSGNGYNSADAVRTSDLCGELASVAAKGAPYQVVMGQADAGVVVLRLAGDFRKDGGVDAELVAQRDSFIGEGRESSPSVAIEILPGADETARASALNEALDEILPWRRAA